MRIIAVSGYFDPLHIGHIELFKLAKALGDKLIVIVNNDKQTEMKKGKYFMPVEERKKILEELKCVDEVFISVDEDRTVRESLKTVKPHVFANGGDRNNSEIPEVEVCKILGIEIVDGLGAKIQSSSELIRKFNENTGEAE
jgi:cytidyltransferase-like protein